LNQWRSISTARKRRPKRRRRFFAFGQGGVPFDFTEAVP
jgi:hypothetical protein